MRRQRRVYDSAAWRRVQPKVLERDGRWCQLRYAKCTGVATTVDHIIRPEDAPELAFEMSNLRAACRSCNTARRNKMRAAWARRYEQQHSNRRAW
jgi:5-methylcytosine-specific restriction endonuclease McrA